MYLTPRNFLVLIYLCFSFCIGQGLKLTISDYKPFPEKIFSLGIEPTQLEWSLVNKFLLLDENRTDLISLDHYGNLSLTSGFSNQNSRFGELIWMGVAPNGIRLIDRIENEIIFLDYRLNPIQTITLEHRIFPELATIDPWGRIYLYSKSYNGIFIFERAELNTIPFIDLSKEDQSFYCITDLASSQDGDLAVLFCDGSVKQYSRNGKIKFSTFTKINDPSFLVALANDWLVFNRQGKGESINSGDQLFIPNSSVPVTDIKTLDQSMAVLTKDHILILDVK